MIKWEGFADSDWKESVNIRDFIINNYSPYYHGEDFLKGPTEKTKKLWKKCNNLILEEIKEKKAKVDLENIASIDGFKPGYIDKENEVIYGLQTDEPLKRIINPYGGIRMVKSSLKENGFELDSKIEKIFTEYRKTHNEAVFGVYTDKMKLVRKSALLTGLPDAYERGRIIGDYRRIALYGIDFLIREKEKDLSRFQDMNEENIRHRDEIGEQIKALNKIKNMAKSYGVDMSDGAENAKCAVQFLYFGYLAAVKENNGAAMSLGRVSTFLDIYIERDIKRGILDEESAQELIDQLVIKLRLVRHLRTKEYDDLFAGDPNWITESIGGMGLDNRTLVTKTSYRFLNTLKNLGPGPEPNMTILWSNSLPTAFKKYVSKLSIETDSIQYENDDLMRDIYGDDYGISCCVSAMKIGKDMQFFGARCNLAKALLYSINGGVDEVLDKKVIDGIDPIKTEVLDYEKVMKNLKIVLREVAEIYVNTMNVIHYNHDKFAYEASQMSLHDTDIHRYMAFGVAGLSVAADSLSAIKYSKVRPIYENGIAKAFETEGEFPCYGNDDDRADSIAVDLLETFISELRKIKAYRNAEHTLSVLTITSNVVYGKKTGDTPDGRKKGEPLAPGANPMHKRDKNGALASLNSVAKLPYKGVCQDGISNTFSIIPEALGKTDENRVSNLVNILDGYFIQKAHHLNVNVIRKELLLEAMENPEKYPNLTIRVSGYAVNFHRLTKEQQQEVISRTYHSRM